VVTCHSGGRSDEESGDMVGFRFFATLRMTAMVRFRFFATLRMTAVGYASGMPIMEDTLG
jgi:hypothetical protein